MTRAFSTTVRGSSCGGWRNGGTSSSGSMYRRPTRRHSLRAPHEPDFWTFRFSSESARHSAEPAVTFPSFIDFQGADMAPDATVVRRFHQVLVEEIRRGAPDYLSGPFTVAEIYQSLVPYRTHRDRIGVELNGDYEAALLRLLGGGDGLLELESEAAQARIRRELDSSNPNTGLYREFAAVQVRLNPDELPPANGKEAGGNDEASASDVSGKKSTFAAESDKASTDERSDRSSSSARETSSAPKQEATPVLLASGSAKKATAPRRAAAPDLVRGAPPSDCPDCESSLPDRETLRFCPFCGANVFIMPCSECGEVLERDWAFCIACGTTTDS
ncbi:MAG: zinc ribbon domain-containing protein [Gemmatimonadales bacterium]|nr:MAG: zinc ribbon domain-containing protein [Gemmatimonadales bacterium]